MFQILVIPANPTLSSCLPELVSQNIEVILNRKTNMEAVLKIIEGNIPEVGDLLVVSLSMRPPHPKMSNVITLLVC